MQRRSNPARLTRAFLCLAIAGSLSACSGNQLTPEQQLAWLQQQSQSSTLRFKCPAGGCELEYSDPRDRPQLPKSTNGYDVANTLIGTAGSVAAGAAPWLAVSKIAAAGFDQSGDTVTGSYNSDSTHAPTVVNQSDPVVVTAPDPVIVNPVVVEQPAPVVVSGSGP